jgi:hypothetical protein
MPLQLSHYVCAQVLLFFIALTKVPREFHRQSYERKEPEAAVCLPFVDHDTQRVALLTAQCVTLPQGVVLCNSFDVQHAGADSMLGSKA